MKQRKQAEKALDWTGQWIAALIGNELPAAISPQEAFSAAPWLARAISLRAGALAAMPFGFWRGDREVPPPFDFSPTLLWQVEASLCLWGAAYLLKERTRSNRVMGLRFLAAPSITPRYDEEQGLTGFERALRTSRMVLSVDDVAYVWLPNPLVEVGPGPAPFQSVAPAALAVRNAMNFVAAYFERGAVPVLLLQVEGMATEQEMQRLRAWWKSLLSGGRRAWEVEAVRTSVKPVVVGEGIEKLRVGPLLEEMRRQIAVGMGIPQTLMEDAANYATAKEHVRSFYRETIVPEARLIEAALNEQVFDGLGVRLQFAPERLEIFQAEEAEKAQGIIALVQAGIMTPDEAREQMGLAPRAAEAGVEAKRFVPEAVVLECRRWRERARKGAGREFKSGILWPALRAFLAERIEERGAAAFDFLKADRRAAHERALQRALGEVLDRERARAMRAVREGEAFGEAEFSAAIRAVLGPALAEAATDAALEELMTIGIQFDPAVISAAALDWSNAYTYDLVRGLADTTRSVIQSAVQAFISTPGMTNEQLEALLAPAFGPVRAEMIAITEVTRAYSAAEGIYQRLLREQGIETRRIWHTAADEVVCDVCQPLNGKSEEVWGADFPDGPPAHVNCRCSVGLEVVRG